MKFLDLTRMLTFFRSDKDLCSIFFYNLMKDTINLVIL